jgi:hypothetical protein
MVVKRLFKGLKKPDNPTCAKTDLISRIRESKKKKTI